MFNLNHLKYVVEVARTNSITKAAENLYMGQPNLSRAIKELEDNLGIVIFKRTPKGLSPTEEGEKFLEYAFNAVEKISEIESVYFIEKPGSKQFSASVARASYISYAFSKFLDRLDASEDINIEYKETNALKTINNILHGNYNVGIIRYAAKYDKNFIRMLDEKNLKYQLIWEYEMLAAMAENHPLAKKENLSKEDLKIYPQIVHGDPYVPFVQPSEISEIKEPESRGLKKIIRIYERGSQFEILRGKLRAYMWVPPIPDSTLARNGIVQREVKDSGKAYKDLLIFRKNYKFSALDNIFIEELRGVFDQNHDRGKIDKRFEMLNNYRIPNRNEK